MSDWIKQLPKAELHVHLEGTMNATVIANLAKKNKLANPEHYFDASGHILWHGISQFIEMYDVLSEYIHTPEDLEHITYAYLEKCHLEGAIYVELTLSPQHAANVGISYRTMLAAVTQGIVAAKNDFGIEARILMVLVRHLGVDPCMEVLEQVIAKSNEYVVGISLAGDERSHPVNLFKKHYQKAKAAGLGLTAHAGEWTGPEQVRDAILHLGVSRIGHGVRAIEDPSLIDLILEKDIHLEVCPMSNFALEVYADFESHPLSKFIELGINFSLNSDDPPFFSTSIGKEYEQAAHHLGLNQKTMKTITDNAIRASFAPSHLKQMLLGFV